VSRDTPRPTDRDTPTADQRQSIETRDQYYAYSRGRVSRIISGIDYGNATLAGHAEYLINPCIVRVACVDIVWFLRSGPEVRPCYTRHHQGFVNCISCGLADRASTSRKRHFKSPIILPQSSRTCTCTNWLTDFSVGPIRPVWTRRGDLGQLSWQRTYCCKILMLNNG